MKKKGIFKIVVALLFVAAAVVWLLSVVMPEKFKDLNFAWLIAAFAGALGLLFIFRGFFSKTIGGAKKFYIFLGAVFIIGGVLALVGTIIDDKLVLPIIAVAITAAGLLSLLAVGGKKWDTADNEKAGYKNYYERKKDEEKLQEKEKND